MFSGCRINSRATQVHQRELLRDIEAYRVRAYLEDWLGLELSVELMFEYQTPAALARYLAARCAAQKSAIG